MTRPGLPAPPHVRVPSRCPRGESVRQGHVKKLESVFENLEDKVRGKHCDGVEGIIEEGKSVMEEDFDDQTMDACLIAAGQRVEQLPHEWAVAVT